MAARKDELTCATVCFKKVDKFNLILNLDSSQFSLQPSSASKYCITEPTKTMQTRFCCCKLKEKWTKVMIINQIQLTIGCVRILPTVVWFPEVVLLICLGLLALIWLFSSFQVLSGCG